MICLTLSHNIIRIPALIFCYEAQDIINSQETFCTHWQQDKDQVHARKGRQESFAQEQIQETKEFGERWCSCA